VTSDDVVAEFLLIEILGLTSSLDSRAASSETAKTPLNSAPARSVAQKKKKKRKERTGKQGGPNGN
jgi:hypothetical protein